MYLYIITISLPRRLNEVLELAEDFEIDIPRVWDYLGEILAPAVSQSTLPLSCLQNVPPALVESGKAAVLAANVLLQCKTLQSEVDVISLWSDSQLQWTDLGVKDVEEFLRKQVGLVAMVISCGKRQLLQVETITLALSHQL